TGPRGGDVLKASVERPDARTLVQRIGAALGWHGALSFDYILEDTTGTPMFIDANPRLVEPMNAWFSGTDLPATLLALSLGRTPPTSVNARSGVVTSLGLMGLLDAAGRRGRRRDVLQEIGLLLCRAGRYRDTLEELSPLGIDPWCLLPLA